VLREAALWAASHFATRRPESDETTRLVFETTCQWHAPPANRCIEAMEADRNAGLTTREAAGRLRRFAPNLLSNPERSVRVRRMAGLFRDVQIWLLIVAAVVSGLLLNS